MVLGSSRLQYCYYDWCILKCIFVWNCSSYAETRVRPFETWLLLPLLGSRSCRCQTQWRCLFGFVCVTPAYCCIAWRAMCPLCVYVWATEWPEPTHLWTLLYVYICLWWYDAHVPSFVHAVWSSPSMVRSAWAVKLTDGDIPQWHYVVLLVTPSLC